jgi:hypothetical protein
MKKILLAIVLGSFVIVALISCSSSRKTGCPMTENIIH